MGAHFEALNEGVLVIPLDSRYTQVGFNLVSVQVWGLVFFRRRIGKPTFSAFESTTQL